MTHDPMVCGLGAAIGYPETCPGCLGIHNHQPTPLEDMTVKRQEVFQSKYLAKEDIVGPLRATIAQVVKEKVGQGAEQETKAVAHFTNDDIKPMVLNGVNWTTLEEAYGEESDFWNGKQCEIYIDPNVLYAGKRVGGIRLRITGIGVNGSAVNSNGSGPWTLEQSIAECQKYGVTRDQMIAHLKSLGNTGYNPARDTVAVQELIRTAPQPDQSFAESGPTGGDIPFAWLLPFVLPILSMIA